MMCRQHRSNASVERQARLWRTASLKPHGDSPHGTAVGEDEHTQRQAALDVPEEVPLYVTEGDGIDDYILGFRYPDVLPTDAAVRPVSEHEIRTIVAQELGHVPSGHVRYTSMVRRVDAGRRAPLPGGMNLVLPLPVVLALENWDRKSELSADSIRNPGGRGPAGQTSPFCSCAVLDWLRCKFGGEPES